MADNVQITAGSGTIVRTIDIGGGVEVQVIVNADSAGNLIGSTTGNNGRGLNTVVLNDIPVVGMDADGSVMQSANQPVYIGGRVRLGTAIVPLTADGNARGFTITGDGRLVTAPIGCPEDQGATTPIIAASDTNGHQFIQAQSASPPPGVKIELWGVKFLNLSANAVGIIFLDGGTEIGRCAIPAAPGGGVTFETPLKTTAAVAMNYQLVLLNGGAVPPANTLFMTPFWYKARA